MPRGDRTGPWGQGAMTGRAAGFCAGYAVPGYANPIPGRGFGRGGGRGRGFGGGGRGWRHQFYATGLPGWARFGGYAVPPGYPVPSPAPDPEQEKQALQAQVQFLESELKSLQQQLSELETKADTE
jgi:hypothetical protein